MCDHLRHPRTRTTHLGRRHQLHQRVGRAQGRAGQQAGHPILTPTLTLTLTSYDEHKAELAKKAAEEEKARFKEELLSPRPGVSSLVLLLAALAVINYPFCLLLLPRPGAAAAAVNPAALVQEKLDQFNVALSGARAFTRALQSNLKRSSSSSNS